MNRAPVVPVLRGSRCVLRPLVPGDAASIAHHANDPLVWRNLFEGFPHPYRLADAEDWCDPARRPAAAGHVWAIEVEGSAIGCCGVVPLAGWLDCNAEVGYWIGQAHWRRGVTSDALGLISAWAFEHLPGVSRLFAPIFAWNEGSQAVARKAGYTLESRMPCSARKGGVLIDRVVYARLRPGALGAVPPLPAPLGA